MQTSATSTGAANFSPGVDRVTLALAIAAGVGWFGFPGLLWDAAWHRTIGRDSFLSPPHILMYAAVAANGLVATWAALRRVRGPGFALMGAGFLVAAVGAVLDEAWHRWVGKDVNLWSPPHLVGLAGAMVMAIGLALAIAAHTRYRTRPGWWVPRVVLLFCFADLIHKSMVALDHYTLDARGRTADFYPFLIALMQPAILVAAVRAVGTGAATASAGVFVLEHAGVLLVLVAAGTRIPTFSPFPLLPALAIDTVTSRSRGAMAAALAGAAFTLTLYLQEAAWMGWVVRQPWAIGDVARGLPPALLAGAASGWVGWTIGGFIRSAAEGRPSSETFGSPRRVRTALAGALLVIAGGALAAYRPSRVEPPATLAALGLAADPHFEPASATFVDELLPDDWRRPGDHATYQEAIIDGQPVPLGPGWCAADEAGLVRDLGRLRFGLSINGETVPLDAYPAVRRRLPNGAHCQWVAVSAVTPRPGNQQLVYTVAYSAPVETRGGVVGPGTSTVTITLRIKEP